MNRYNQLMRICLIAAVVTLTACASSGPGQLTQSTSQAVPIDARLDNEPLLAASSTGLLVTINVANDQVELEDVRVMTVPDSVRRAREGQDIRIVGSRSGQPIVTTAIPDQRVNVQENRGLVLVAERQLSFTLPVPARIDSLEVLLPGRPAPEVFDIREYVESYCEEVPRTDPMCRGDVRGKDN